MKYIVCKQFKKRAICGDVNLIKGTTLNETNGIIYHNEDQICFKTSQNAFDYFARNDDGKGKERFALTSKILDKIKDLVIETNEAMFAKTDDDTEPAPVEDKVSKAYSTIRESYPRFLKGDLDIFSVEFYNAEIADLEKVQELVCSL